MNTIHIGRHAIDMQKAAHEIALLYAQEAIKPGFTPSSDDITRMAQAYIKAYIAVSSMDETDAKVALGLPPR